MESADVLARALSGIAAGASLLTLLLLSVWLLRARGLPRSGVGQRPLAGTLARVVVGIPKHGIGRIAYRAHGKRCSMAAKSDEHEPIAAGTEVVVIAHERGIALVVTLESEPGGV